MSFHKLDKTALALTVLVAIYIISRLLLFHDGMDLLSGDNAIWAIMSTDILQGKNFPIFFYGASRTGSLETYFTALFFAIGGISANVYHVSRIILFAPFILIVYYTVRRISRDSILNYLIVLWVIFPSYYLLYIAAFSPGYILFLCSSSLLYLVSSQVPGNGFEKNNPFFYIYYFTDLCADWLFGCINCPYHSSWSLVSSWL